MKKIFLFSVIMCGLSGVAFGENFCGFECISDRDGKFMVCPGDTAVIKKCNGTSWEDIGTVYDCSETMEAQPGYINVGVWNRGVGTSLWVKKGTAKTGNGYLFDNENKENFCNSCRQGFKWSVAEAKCVNVAENSVTPSCDPNHPENCRQNPRVPQLSKPCGGDKKVNDFCNAGNHATLGRCRNLDATKDGVTQFTCAATECENGYLLWLDVNGNSRGICHSVEYANNYCAQGRCQNTCSGSQKCVPWVVDTPNNLQINGRNLVPKQNGAYRECHCVDEQENRTPSEKSDCEYEFSVLCKNRITSIPNDMIKGYPKTIPLTQTELKKAEYKEYNLTNTDIAQCKDSKKLNFKESSLVKKLYKKDVKTVYDKLKQDADLANKVREFCKDHGGYDIYIYQSSGGGDVDAARKTVMDFFNYAKNNKTVWKTVDGKFNTARLASDLTAGVVLGTVGGVVSGVVIKKKQVEKGFDALHCAVGGQSIADWGDTFDVGLR